MSVRRTATAIVVLTTLLLALAAPAGAATETTSRGTAATTSVPLHIEALDLPIDLGEVGLLATTDGDTDDRAPWSSVGLTLATIDGTSFGDLEVTSDGMTSNPGQTFGEDTAVGSVGATVANLLAIADDTAGSATAAVTSLDATATILSDLGLQATLTDVVSSVDDTGAAATHTLALAGVDLDLAHILGSVLDDLPLGDLLTLADELGVAVPVNLDPVNDVVVATEELVAAVTAAVTAADAVETAASDLLTADGGTLEDLQGLITDVGSINLLSVTLLADVQAILDDAAFPTDCDVDLLSVTINQTLLDSIVACLESAVDGHLASLSEELAALQQAVEDYVAAVAAAATAATDGSLTAGTLTVSDVLADIQTLITDLLAADLAAISPIEVSQQVRAIGSSYEGSSASHTCRLTTIQALAETPVEIADCDGGTALDPVIDTITGTLGTVLSTVGGVDVGDGVSLELFGKVESLVSETDDDFVRATSVMEVLRLTIPDITITPCEIGDGLVCELGLDLDGTLATVLGTLGGALTDAQQTAEDAINSVSALLGADALDAANLVTDVTGVDAAAAQTAVDQAVTDLTAVLNSLLAALADLTLGTASGTVPGATIVVDPQLEAEHQVVAASVDDPTPADPAPTPDDPSLPNTGGGAALLAVLALGGGTWLWRSRRREA